ncbi:hypothetical protein Pfo_020489, partial [Paulownia fortunei]
MVDMDKALQEQNNFLAKKIKEREKELARPTAWEQQNHDLNSSCFDKAPPLSSLNVRFLFIFHL